jgi:hypothetical protein
MAATSTTTPSTTASTTTGSVPPLNAVRVSCRVAC